MKTSLILALAFFTSQATAITLNEWQQLSPLEKIEYMDGNPSVEIHLNDTKVERNHARIDQANIEATMVQLRAFEPGFNIEVEDDYYATIGAHKITADLYYSDDHQFLGANIYYKQYGCSHFDQNGEFIDQAGHYANTTEAEANGCTDNDVSWVGSSIIDEQMQELSNSDYMEWSGY
jgi:hypothetical protein